MKKIILLSLMLLALFLVWSCVPPNGESGEKTALAGLAISKTCYDADNDGYGRSGNSIRACSGSTRLFDCDDTNRDVNPGAREICGNRIDDNCNKRVDEGGCVMRVIPVPASCTPSTEICDGVDNDCDGQVDEDIICYDGCPNSNCMCTDSDGGINLMVGGYAITTLPDGRSIVLNDTCLSETYVNEVICDSTDFVGVQIGAQPATMCPSGTICLDPDGSGPTPAYCSPSPTYNCIDNDPANDPTIGGTLTITNSSSGGVLPLTWTFDNDPELVLPLVDSCFMRNIVNGSVMDNIGGSYINESACYNSTSGRLNSSTGGILSFRGSFTLCSSGTTCQDPDGALGVTPAYCGPSSCGNNIVEAGELCDDGNTINGDGCTQCRCADTDQGRSPITRGTVTTADGEFKDVCSSEIGSITERFCADDGSLQSEDLRCYYGMAADDPYRNEFGTSCETVSYAAGCVIIG